MMMNDDDAGSDGSDGSGSRSCTEGYVAGGDKVPSGVKLCKTDDQTVDS